MSTRDTSDTAGGSDAAIEPVETEWVLADRRDGFGATHCRYRYWLSDASGDVREHVAFQLELRNWERLEDADGEIVLEIDDFVPTLGLAVDPAVRASAILSEGSRALASYGKQIAALATFVAVFVLVAGLLTGWSFGGSLCCMMSAVTVLLCGVLFLADLPGWRLFESRTPAQIRLLKAPEGTVADVRIHKKHYTHDSAVAEKLREDLHELVQSD